MHSFHSLGVWIPTGITHSCPLVGLAVCHQETTLASGIPGLAPGQWRDKQLNKFWHINNTGEMAQSKGALTLSINTKTKTDLIGL